MQNNANFAQSNDICVNKTNFNQLIDNFNQLIDNFAYQWIKLFNIK